MGCGLGLIPKELLWALSSAIQVSKFNAQRMWSKKKNNSAKLPTSCLPEAQEFQAHSTPPGWETVDHLRSTQWDGAMGQREVTSTATEAGAQGWNQKDLT